MASRPLNDDEVLSEMNKMVRMHARSPSEAASHDAQCVYTACCLITPRTTGCVHQAGGT